MTDESPDSPDGPPTSGEASDGPSQSVNWPVDLRGVTESVTATRGQNDRWNLAALGLYAPGRSPGENDELAAGVTARTWGTTRTRRNFRERGAGYVLFVRDPVVFVDAALSVLERDDPVHPAADAWARVTADRVRTGERRATEWVDWRLTPRQTGVRQRSVVPVNRGFGAVVEATVVASRLDVDAYDTAAGLRRLSRLAGVVETCGGDRERRALERVDEHVGWRDRSD